MLQMKIEDLKKHTTKKPMKIHPPKTRYPMFFSIFERTSLFQIFVIFTPILGEDSHFDSYFTNGLKPPTRNNGDISFETSSQDFSPKMDTEFMLLMA